MSYNSLLVIAVGLGLKVFDATFQVFDFTALFFIGLVAVGQGCASAKNHDETPDDNGNNPQPGEPRHGIQRVHPSLPVGK